MLRIDVLLDQLAEDEEDAAPWVHARWASECASKVMGAMVHLRQAGNKRSLQVAADVVNSVTSLLDALEHVKIDDADDAENQKEALIGLI
eukprot:COSAG01_NODE_4708_length_4799_cov_4.376809_4_plen_89_part_01